MKLDTIVLAALPGVVVAQWGAASHSGLRCTGQQIALFEPFGGSQPSLDCREIDSTNNANSVLFFVDEDAGSGWTFSLYPDECDSAASAGSYRCK